MMQLHGFAMSPNTRRARMALEETGLPYEFVPVDLMSGAHRQPDYLRLNPTGRVPALVDGDFVLWESNAILQYAAALAPEKKLDGSTPRERAEIGRWMFMNAAHLSPAVARIFAHTIRLPEEQRLPRIVTESRAEVDRSLAAIDAHLANREHLLDRFTIADISVAPSLSAAPMLGIDLSAFTHVAAWLARVQARPAWSASGG